MIDESLRILAAHSNSGIARAPGGEVLEVFFRRRTGRPLPGDRVTVDEQRAVSSILPRSNVFGRGDSRARFRPVAANLDRLLILIAAQPAPSGNLLHRYLAAAWIQGIEPLVIVHKCDLPVPDEPPFSEFAELQLPVFHTRSFPEVSLNGLKVHLAHGISLLAGQSGVGKTSLANALVPDLEAQTRTLSRVTGKGTHTTTTAQLHRLPSGGWLVDTPGVWEYNLWRMTPAELEHGFPEFMPHRGDCRFRDCRHIGEPDCAVQAAALEGHIPRCRYEAWRRLLAEQERLAAD